MHTVGAIVGHFLKFIISYFNLTNIKDVVTIMALTVGIYVGVSGLRTWKRQLVGNQDYHLAKSILVNLYKYKESLFQLRHPAVMGFEYPEFSSDDLNNISHKERSYRSLAHAYQKRWERLAQAKPNFYEVILESQALWGDKLRLLMAKLFKLEFELQQAISYHLQARNPNEQHGKVPYDRDLVYDSLQDNDPYRLRVDAIIQSFEEDLKPRLKL